MSDYLTPAELFELTGRKLAPAQLAWLKARRWRHETTADGKPRVLRAYRDRRLLDASTEVPETAQPRFEVILPKARAA